MLRRNVITDLNPDWIIGFVEERPDEQSEWKRALHSEWVFARIAGNVGERAPDDVSPFSVPKNTTLRLVVGEPGMTVVGMMDMVRVLDRVALEAHGRMFKDA
jgi:hypothetical protein